MQIVYFKSALLLFVLCEIARIKRSCSSCFCCGLKIVTNKVRVKTTWCPNKFWIEISKPSKIRICPKKSSNFHDFFVFGDFLLHRPKLVGTPCVDLETANNCTDFSPICLLVKIPSKKYVRMMINDDDDAEKKNRKSGKRDIEAFLLELQELRQNSSEIFGILGYYVLFLYFRPLV